MQEADEQDTCRICSAPAEPDQPLFHPCKCSGTIRYIHQDCLTTWLAHSRKKTCDVCKHPYSFTKVYAPNMPSHLPPFLLLRRLIQQLLYAIIFVVRVAGVALIWLAVLPWITVWTWRIYFSVGETTAWWISNRPRQHHNETISLFQKVPLEADPKTLLAYITTHTAWLSLSADIFAGQIIAALIVITFVSVFLLREWISQNARPGLFEEEDFVAPEEPAPAPQEPRPARPPLAQRFQGFPDNDAFARRQEEALHALNVMRNPVLRNPPPMPPLPLPNEQAFIDRMQRPEHRRRIKAIRTLAARRRAKATQKPDRELPTLPVDHHDPMYKPPGWLSQPTSPDAQPAGLFFPPVKLEQPNTDIPFAIRSPPTFSEPGPSTQRRPTLPVSTLATANGDHSFTISPGRSPMTSPGLATYHPPEELAQEPSYFDMERDIDDDMLRWKGQYHDTHENGVYLRDSEGDFSDHVDAEASPPAPGRQLYLSDDETEEEEEENIPLEPEHEALEFFEAGVHEEEEDEDDADMFFIDAEEAARRAQEREAAMMNGQVEPQPQNFNAVNDAPQGGFVDDQGFDPNDDLDGNVEDDMEGALEAVGIRGPIFGVFQNAALMVFVLDTAIGLCIWVPFTVGKTAALLALDPRRFLQLLHLPIKAMRLATDPVVDSIAYIVTRFVLPPWVSVLKKSSRLLGTILGNVSTTVLGVRTTYSVSEFSNKMYIQSLDFLNHSPLAFWSASKHVDNVAQVHPEPEHLFPESARFVEPYFAELGKNVRVSAVSFKDAWTRMAEGNGSSERVFAVCLGYAVFGLLVALYLNILTVGNARTAGRAIRNAIRQQLLVVKVAGFIFIELVVFPLGCGAVLDVCTVWLFPEANIQSRLAFFSQAPLTALFYHWIAGTLFMYSFAVLLSGCRSIMRAGAMWFVKDPEDRNAHPIRDILERHTLTQLRKICLSGLMYAFVVVCLVGSVAGLLILGNKSILPFRWKNREPLSDVPIDLLFLHMVLPQSMHHFRPRRFVRNFAGRLWRELACTLRLSSYFFGGRFPSEELTSRGWILDEAPDGSINGYFEGTFRRVPATDSLALPRDIRVTARVNEDGTPYDAEAAALMAQQDLEAVKAKHDPSKDYMVVYLPPYFRYRLMVFMFTMWSVCAVMFGAAVAIPIQLGRSVFKIFIPREVHDGYSLIVGFYLLWACYLVGKSIDRLDKRRQRVRMEDGPGRVADLRLLVVKRSLLWLAKSAYMALTLGVVVPILLALVVDLYVVLPLRTAFTPGLVPKIRLVDAWAIGLVYGKIALHVTQLQPPNRVTLGLHHIIANGWVRLNPVTATKEVIGPLVGGLLAMIVMPGLWVQIVRYFVPSFTLQKSPILMNLYPAIFVVAGLIRSSVVVYDILSTWSQSVRDKEFLVELRLRNHEPDVQGVMTEAKPALVEEKSTEFIRAIEAEVWEDDDDRVGTEPPIEDDQEQEEEEIWEDPLGD